MLSFCLLASSGIGLPAGTCGLATGATFSSQELELGTGAQTKRCTTAAAKTHQAPILTTRSAIHTLRVSSGLTWEQIAELFQVSRRSLHFWASGKALAAENEARLMQVLGVLRYIDRGDSLRTRRALLEPDPRTGVRAFDLLAGQKFNEARELLGKGEGGGFHVWQELSPEEQAARRPPRPWELLDQLPDEVVHRDLGISRPARTLRTKRREHP
ncbi:MAG: XRE family transcriptional regulator [Planctomycetes bacterium]|nr:XRE family transcriptional regulator [Planctomycetota bacterium]